MKFFGLPLAAALCCAAVATDANAALITKSFNFRADNFTAVNSQADAPVDPVVGRFTITYDDAAFLITPRSQGLEVEGFNLPYDGTAQFYYSKGSNLLIIANAFVNPFAGAYQIGGGSQFGFAVFNVNTNPRVDYFSYSSGGLPIYETRNVSLAAVPEPATWAMMIGGFGMIGGALRSTRRGRAIAAAA